MADTRTMSTTENITRLADPAPPPPTEWELGYTKREEAIIRFCLSQMSDLSDKDWRDHGYRRSTFDAAYRKFNGGRTFTRPGAAPAQTTLTDEKLESVLRLPVADGEDVGFYLLHGCEGVSPEVEAIMVREVARTIIRAVPLPWVLVRERLPEIGTYCVVWKTSRHAKGQHMAIDRWGEQHEAPLAFSSETIPIGPGWDESDFDSVTHWQPIKPPAEDK
jgi:hypothetical protein